MKKRLCIVARAMRPQICLRPNTTIKQSLSHKRPLINISIKEKTLRSNIRHETKGLLPFFITIKQSQSHKRTLINIRKNRNDFSQ